MWHSDTNTFIYAPTIVGIEEEEIQVEETEGKSEDVINAERGLKRQEMRFNAARAWILKLDEGKLEEMKRSRKPTAAVQGVLRATLLILDAKYTELKTWDQIRSVCSWVTCGV